MANILKKRFFKNINEICKNEENSYAVFDNFFGHYKNFDSNLLEVLLDNSNNKLIITQSEKFREQCYYDPAALTFEILKRRLLEIIPVLKIAANQKVDFLVLDFFPNIITAQENIKSSIKKTIMLEYNDKNN
tara:strand:+ start:1678 stop:2073 length:396 start_codon:yes stop_codon:yes gene_type:complete